MTSAQIRTLRKTVETELGSALDRALKAFDESKHPRAEDGRFGQGSGYVNAGDLGPGVDVNAGVREHMRRIRETGEVMPIEVDHAGTIVDGEHRYRAMMELGVSKIPVYVGEQEGASGRLKKPYAGLAVNVKTPTLTKEGARAFGAQLGQKHGAKVELFLTNRGDLELAHIEVPKENRKAGVGTAVMGELTAYADQHGRRVILDPATRGDSMGTTSRTRLVDFYGRHGFVRNRGRHQDSSISAGMYRDPEVKKDVMTSGGPGTLVPEQGGRFLRLHPESPEVTEAAHDPDELQKGRRIPGGLLHARHWHRGDAGLVEKDYEESEHPRDDAGQWTSGGLSSARAVAERYVRSTGRAYREPDLSEPLDQAEARRVATAYDQMEHAPDDPEVKRAYRALADETMGQWGAMRATGLKVTPAPPSGDPYHTAEDLVADVRDNHHLYYFPTTEGFGSADVSPAANPLLASSGVKDDSGRPMLVNDVFRAVHDYFGHAQHGASFRPDGEEDAFRSHAAMYSKLAGRAMTTETRGQASWVYFGPYRAQNAAAKTGADVHFADQKTGLLPEEFSVAKDEQAAWSTEADGGVLDSGRATLHDRPRSFQQRHGVNPYEALLHPVGAGPTGDEVVKALVAEAMERRSRRYGDLHPDPTGDFPVLPPDAQVAMSEGWDESKHPRGEGGKFGAESVDPERVFGGVLRDPTHPIITRRLRDWAAGPVSEGSAKLTTTRADSLYASQDHIDAAKVAAIMKSPRAMAEPVDVVDYNGVLVIEDGHHRAAAHALRGEPVPVRVRQWEEKVERAAVLKAGDAVAFDFDATMTVDEDLTPNPRVLAVVRELLADGVAVKVLSARAGTPEGAAQIRAWLDEQDLGAVTVTSEKTPDIRVTVDDRAIHWEPGMDLTAEQLEGYRSWFEKAFDESKHPRDQEGKFGAGSSSDVKVVSDQSVYTGAKRWVMSLGTVRAHLLADPSDPEALDVVSIAALEPGMDTVRVLHRVKSFARERGFKRITAHVINEDLGQVLQHLGAKFTPTPLGHVGSGRRRLHRHPGRGDYAIDLATLKSEDAGLAVENDAVAANRAVWANRSHDFVEADWTAGNGHPRCLLCGDEEPVGGRCQVVEKGRSLAFRTTFQGLPVSIENERGSVRRWHDPLTGRDGETRMPHHYGYIRMTEGEDGDHVDCYLGPNPDATHAYVVRQVSPKTGEYDEDKCMLGFDSAAEARDAYMSAYDDPRFFGGMTTLPMADFIENVLATKDEPGAVQKAWDENQHPRADDGRFGEGAGHAAVAPPKDRAANARDDLRAAGWNQIDSSSNERWTHPERPGEVVHVDRTGAELEDVKTGDRSVPDFAKPRGEVAAPPAPPPEPEVAPGAVPTGDAAVDELARHWGEGTEQSGLTRAAVAEKFGGAVYNFTDGKKTTPERVWADLGAEGQRPEVEAAADRQYARTQEMLGKGKTTLYRGVVLPGKYRAGAIVNLDLGALSSFSESPDTATDYASDAAGTGKTGYVLELTVDHGDVYGNYATGIGGAPEKEWLVLGRGRKAKLRVRTVVVDVKRGKGKPESGVYKYNEDHDERGRFASGGGEAGGGGGGGSASAPRWGSAEGKRALRDLPDFDASDWTDDDQPQVEASAVFGREQALPGTEVGEGNPRVLDANEFKPGWDAGGRREDVDLTGLTPSQAFLNRAGVESYFDRDVATLPVVARFPNGEVQIIDGHHRLAAAKLSGKTTASVVVLTVNEDGKIVPSVRKGESFTWSTPGGEVYGGVVSDAIGGVLVVDCEDGVTRTVEKADWNEQERPRDEVGQFASAGLDSTPEDAADLKSDLGWAPGDKGDVARLVRLQEERQTAVTELDELSKKVAAGDVEVEVGDEGTLTSAQEDEAQDHYMHHHYDAVYQNELESYGEMLRDNSEETRRDILNGSVGAGDRDFAMDTARELVDDTDWADDDGIEIKPDKDSFAEAMSHWDGDAKLDSVNWKTIKWEGEPEPPAEGQGELPGVEPGDYQARVERYRADQWGSNREYLAKEMESRLDKETEAQIERMLEDPPSDLSDSARETVRDSWDSMSDDTKYEYAKDNDVVEEGTTPGSTAAPKTWAVLESTEVGYKETQGFVRTLQKARVLQVAEQRGLKDFDYDQINDTVWGDWKGSLTSDSGLALQEACARELGSHSRLSEGRLAEAEIGAARLGGWDNLRAYVRGTWDTTQYAMEKAGLAHLKVYRAVILDKDEVERLPKTLHDVMTDDGLATGDTVSELPTIQLKKNGAQSFTAKAGVANSWAGVAGSPAGGYRVVLKATVPASAVLSLPVYGVNEQEEAEVVVMGTPWKSWQAWFRTAPSGNMKTEPRAFGQAVAAAEGLTVDLNDHPGNWLAQRRARRAKMRAIKAAWDESRHPRAEDGRFGDVAGAPAVTTSSSTDDIRRAVEEAGGRLDGVQEGQLGRGEKWVWWTHPKTGSSSLWRIRAGQPMTVRDMRSDFDRHVAAFQAHQEEVATAGEVLPWHSPENRQRAAEVAEHRVNDVVVYRGGSRTEHPGEDKVPPELRRGIVKGERFRVTGFNGTDKAEKSVYYRLQSMDTGKNSVLAGRFITKAEGNAPPVDETKKPVPEPKPREPRGPKTPPGQVPPREEIDAVYAKAETGRAVGQTLERRMKKLSPGFRARLDGLHVDHARRLAAEFEHLAHEYPAVVSGMNGVLASTRLTNAWATADMWGGNINVSVNSFGEFSAGRAMQAFRSTAATGFHPRNCTHVESLMAHEFGHIVEAHVRKNMVEHEGVRDFTMAGGFHKWEVPGMDYELLSTASEYARTNKREAFAEAFADYTMYRRGRRGVFEVSSAKTAAARTMETWLVGREAGDETVKPNHYSPARHG
jgi:GNAT superfamily N-acetyltransferase